MVCSLRLITMNQSLLGIIHRTVLSRASKLNYPYEIPVSLSSLNKESPTTEELICDYNKLTVHFKHPIFIDFVPKYSDMVNNKYYAWLMCYNNR